MADIVERLKQVIQNHFGIASESLDENKPITEYGLDSLAMIDLLFELEDHFGIAMPDTAAGIGTLGDLAKVIGDLCAQSQPV